MEDFLISFVEWHMYLFCCLYCWAHSTSLDEIETKLLCSRNVSINNLGCVCRYDNDDHLSKESACSDIGDVRIVTVKEEREMPHDCLSTETDDTLVILWFYAWFAFENTLHWFYSTFNFIRNSCHPCSDSLSKNISVHNGWSSPSEARIWEGFWKSCKTLRVYTANLLVQCLPSLIVYKIHEWNKKIASTLRVS